MCNWALKGLNARAGHSCWAVFMSVKPPASHGAGTVRNSSSISGTTDSGAVPKEERQGWGSRWGPAVPCFGHEPLETPPEVMRSPLGVGRASCPF